MARSADAVVIGNKLIETMEQAVANAPAAQQTDAAVAAASGWLRTIRQALDQVKRKRLGLNAGRDLIRDETSMSWIEKLLPPRINKTSDSGARRVPEACGSSAPHASRCCIANLAANLHVCPKCDHHMRIGSRARIDSLLDLEGRVEIGQTTRSVDTLKFKDTRKYRASAGSDRQTGETDALVVMGGSIRGVPATVACFEFEFMGGSMGSVVGERFVRGAQARARQQDCLYLRCRLGRARIRKACCR